MSGGRPRPKCESPADQFALVVDDEETMRDILCSLLCDIGYTVVMAANGREALAIANDREYSFAIVDLAMPDVNGLQTCAALRKMPKWQDVPIIILTNFSIDAGLKVAVRAGASGFLCKPVDPLEFFSCIEAQIQRTQKSRVGGRMGSHLPAEPVTEETLARFDWILRHSTDTSLDLPWDVQAQHLTSAPVEMSGRDQVTVTHDEKHKDTAGEGWMTAQVANASSIPDTDKLAGVAKFFGPSVMARLLDKLVVLIQETLTLLEGGHIGSESTEMGHRLHNLSGTAGTLGCSALSASARDLEYNPSFSDQSKKQFTEIAGTTLKIIESYTAGLAPALASTSSRNVLVVDDSAIIREIASAFLRAGGHNVTCVESGAEAILAVAATDFQVVLMDVRMPGMDGSEATRRIRAIGGPRGRVPIVALTALTSADQLAKCRNAGMDRFLAKPFDAETLFAILSDLPPTTTP